MRKYPLHVISSEPDEYSQIGTSEPDGDILAAVYVNDRRNTDNPYYSEASYIALTWRTDITDRHILQVGGGKKKVLQVLPGRMTRLLLADWGSGL